MLFSLVIIIGLVSLFVFGVSLCFMFCYFNIKELLNVIKEKNILLAVMGISASICTVLGALVFCAIGYDIIQQLF